MSFCSSCGEALVPGWSFCENCGARVERARMIVAAVATTRAAAPPVYIAPTAAPAFAPTPPAVPVAGESPTARLRRRLTLKTATIGLVVLVLPIALAAGMVDGVRTHDRLDDTKSVLTTTRADLKTSQVNLFTTAQQLGQRTTERDDVQRRLDGVQQQLGGVQRTLSDTRTRVELQAGHIDVLKTCLSGLGEAFYQASLGNFEATVAALDAVEPACEKSESLL